MNRYYTTIGSAFFLFFFLLVPRKACVRQGVSDLSSPLKAMMLFFVLRSIALQKLAAVL
jgi:hypothetical protein